MDSFTHETESADVVIARHGDAYTASIHFADGVLAGLQLAGFTIQASPDRVTVRAPDVLQPGQLCVEPDPRPAGDPFANVTALVLDAFDHFLDYTERHATERDGDDVHEDYPGQYVSGPGDSDAPVRPDFDTRDREARDAVDAADGWIAQLAAHNHVEPAAVRRAIQRIAVGCAQLAGSLSELDGDSLGAVAVARDLIANCWPGEDVGALDLRTVNPTPQPADGMPYIPFAPGVSRDEEE